tara:strand:+ start:246 stop:689 length:444 start_codon:yes stop_codon:yes gene_type:complete
MSLIAGMDDVVEHIKKLEEENKKLKERVAIMDRCKAIHKQNCQEDPDDDPDRKGTKWYMCLEGGLAYYFKENQRWSDMVDRNIKYRERGERKIKIYEDAIYDIREYLTDYDDDGNPVDLTKFDEILCKYNIHPSNGYLSDEYVMDEE